jgi:hypothetical protein
MMKADIVPTLPTEVILHGRELASAEVLAVARHYAPVSLGVESLMRINAARQVIDRLADEGQTVYGVTTGFGHLSRVRIPHEQLTTCSIICCAAMASSSISRRTEASGASPASIFSPRPFQSWAFGGNVR